MADNPSENTDPQKRKTYHNIAEHFDTMAPRYDRGAKKVAWCGPLTMFTALNMIHSTPDEYATDPLYINPLHPEKLPPERPIQLLDLGTGTGEIGRLFKQRFKDIHITGVDIALKMLEKARENGHIDDSHHGSIEDLRWSKSDQFDVVTACGVLDFIESPENVITQSLRVLRPAGLMALTFEPEGTDHPGHKTLQHDEQTLSDLFRKHGGRLILDGIMEEAYRNFADKTHQAVENRIMVLQKDFGFKY
ncbi:MAG: class I SAM-dependent methyltransferase [Alphaproteobacteria bacterium]|nr:class I SAM-dependent methyltransferase [Alphaproteobacteria bacterium]